MTEYHKIVTLFERDPSTNHKTLLHGVYATPEFEYLAKCRWTWSEKIDGTNIRVIISPDGSVQFGGKTDAAQIPAKLVATLREMFGDASALTTVFPGGAALYGEGCGAGIQKGGGNYSPSQTFVLFDARIGSVWLEEDAVADIAVRLALQKTARVGEGTLPEMAQMVEAGFPSAFGNFLAEGIVARPSVALLDRRGARIITKLKHKDFHSTQKLNKEE